MSDMEERKGTGRSYRSQLVRRKYYYPDESDRYIRYKICLYSYLGDNGLIMLCRHDSDYVVLMWHDVQPGYIPEDKWAGNRESGHELYLEMRERGGLGRGDEGAT